MAPAALLESSTATTVVPRAPCNAAAAAGSEVAMSKQRRRRGIGLAGYC